MSRFTIACSAGGFGGFHLSSVKPPFWICWRLGEDWGENVGGGGGRGRKNKPAFEEIALKHL